MRRVKGRKAGQEGLVGKLFLPPYLPLQLPPDVVYAIPLGYCSMFSSRQGNDISGRDVQGRFALLSVSS